MRKLLSTAIVLVCVVLLSSCEYVPFGLGLSSDNRQANAQMEKIASAVNSHDAAALKAIFSKRALEDAQNIDAGLDHFLSFFPNGGLTWDRRTVDSDSRYSHGKKTEMLEAFYTVSADGNDYSLFFADFTVNEVYDPDNVGIYGLGVTPLTDDRDAGTAEPFYWWTGSIHADTSNPDGYPGVFVGYENSELSLHMMKQILEALSHQDPLGVRAKFSEYARTENAAPIDDGLDKLVALFPTGDVVWQEDHQEVLVVREDVENSGKTTLLLSTYRVSSGGLEYRLSFAYFPENAIDPSNIGIYAIGVAPWTEAGDSPAEKALFSWADSFQVDASVPPGIFIGE